jgi:hypothetical protein
MPWGVAASVGGALVSSALAPSTGSSSAGPAYQPTDQYGMDQSYQQNYGQYGSTLNSYYGQTNPQAYATYQGQTNNPYAAQYTQGAQTAQNAYYGLGASAGQQATGEYNAANSLMQSANNWDANGQVYQNLMQTTGDSSNAQNYLRGINSSPYGAAVTSNALSGAQLSYANTQLQNQESATAAAGQANQAGAGLQNTSAQAYNTGSSLPYNAQNSIYGNQTTALNNYYGSSISPYMSGLNQLQSNAGAYIGIGQAAQSQAAQQSLSSAQLQQQQAAGITSGLSSAINGISNGYNSSPGTNAYGFNTGSSALSSPSTYDYASSGYYGSY